MSFTSQFYQRREVKDMLSYLRCVNNPRDWVSFQRIANVPPRGIGDKTLSDLLDWGMKRSLTPGEAVRSLARNAEGAAIDLAPRVVRTLSPLGELLCVLDRRAGELALPDLVQEVFKRSGYEDYLRTAFEDGDERIENVEELVAASVKYAAMPPVEGLASFLEEVALVSDTDAMRGGSEAVTLITLHAAKGLEFPAVFIAGFEEELCPHVRSFDDPAQMEEERRLAYVGMTRAADRLYFCYARFRGGWGSSARLPSRFLRDVPGHLLDWGRAASRESFPDFGLEKRKAAPAAPLPTERSFPDGQRVRHAVFGNGMVVSGKIGPGGEEVKIVFEGPGIKLLSVAFADLERI